MRDRTHQRDSEIHQRILTYINIPTAKYKDTYRQIYREADAYTEIHRTGSHKYITNDIQRHNRERQR